MKTFTCDHPNEIYKDVIREIINSGDDVSPRGLKTLEINPAIHHVSSPAKRLCSVPGRKANPFFNLAENMWILIGNGSSEWISTFNNKLDEYQLDEGYKDYNAPYGRRIRFHNRHRKDQLTIKLNPYNEIQINQIRFPEVDQLYHCWKVLKEDKYSRHAVITLWNPVFDYFYHKTKDRPCNTTIYFKIRKNKEGNDVLNMTVSNRSNDLHLGLYGVNFVQFSHIQEFLAASLNVGIGHYVHISDSLHIYDTSKHTENILNADYNFDVYEFAKPNIISYNYVAQISGKVEPVLADFLDIPNQVVSESIEFRKFYEGNSGNGFMYKTYRFKYSASDLAKSYSYYLFSYDLFKAGDFEDALHYIYMAEKLGLSHDWFICGLEFMFRNKVFYNRYIQEITNWFNSNPNYNKEDVKKICMYFERH